MVPLVFTSVALAHQLLKQFYKKKEYEIVSDVKIPEIPNRWKQPLPQVVQSCLVLLAMGQYTFLFAWRLKDVVSGDKSPLYSVVDPMLSFASWVSIFYFSE
jgi:hypothetical protein